MVARRKRILFVSESITLAQIVRLAVLAGALDPYRYDLHFAATQFPSCVSLPFSRWPLWGLSAEHAQARLAAGKRIYSFGVLRRYVASDSKVIDAVKPDLIVGDLRWSLAVSATSRQVPVAGLINAYWSRFAQRESFPLPDHPVVRWLGQRLATRYFPKALPWVFRHFAAPLNRLRAEAGLSPVGDLLDVLNFGDFLLYPDPLELVPMRALPGTHRFLGAVPWSAPGQPPEDWGKQTGRIPIYVTMGSSGASHALLRLLAALRTLPVDILLSTAGRACLATDPLSPAVRRLSFVDGDAACARARLVIHNGGASTGYQALAAGTPVLGLPSNLDQCLASERIDAQGAGLSLRAGSLTTERVQHAVHRLLEEASFATQAKRLQRIFRTYDPAEGFRRFVAQAA